MVRRSVFAARLLALFLYILYSSCFWTLLQFLMRDKNVSYPVYSLKNILTYSCHHVMCWPTLFIALLIAFYINKFDWIVFNWTVKIRPPWNIKKISNCDAILSTLWDTSFEKTDDWRFIRGSINGYVTQLSPLYFNTFVVWQIDSKVFKFGIFFFTLARLPAKRCSERTICH